jgi:hypothetical protein
VSPGWDILHIWRKPKQKRTPTPARTITIGENEQHLFIETVTKPDIFFRDGPDLVPASEWVAKQLSQNPDLIFSRSLWAADTPLHAAAKNGQLAMAKLLLANRAEVDARNNHGETPLHQAASHGSPAMAELLLANNAEVDAETGFYDSLNFEGVFTPLHRAASSGHLRVAEILLAYGASVAAENASRWTPLHLAAKYGHAEMVKLLLANKAKLVPRATTRWTPLLVAAIGGHTATAKLLLERGTDARYLAIPPGHLTSRAEYKLWIGVMTEIGRPAVKLLCSTLWDQIWDEVVSPEAAIALTRIGDTRAVKPLHKVLKRRNFQHMPTAIALLRLGDTITVKPMLDSMRGTQNTGWPPYLDELEALLCRSPSSFSIIALRSVLELPNRVQYLVYNKTGAGQYSESHENEKLKELAASEVSRRERGRKRMSA